VRAIEEHALRAVDRVWTCTDLDRRRLSEVHRVDADRIGIVPNTVTVGPPRAQATAVGQVVFVGRLDWFPNIEAAEFVIDDLHPALRRRGTRLTVTIAGAHPSPALSGRRLPDGVRLLADPPSIATLWHSAVLVVPLRLGGGSRLKIMEAFAAGVPVVTTGKGIEGIAADPGRHYLLAETAEAMADAVVRLAADAALRQRVVEGAYRLVNASYGPGAAAAAVRKEIQRVSETGPILSTTIHT
jgi:glycosyltransferase involved in cell wall biosynthesis